MSVRRRVIVCGGRDYSVSIAAFDAMMRPYCGSIVVHGACPTGLDAMAAWWCKTNDVAQEPHPAEWKARGRAAGPLRNQEMVDAGAAECLAWPGGRGTADMMRRALLAGIPITVMGGSDA